MSFGIDRVDNIHYSGDLYVKFETEETTALWSLDRLVGAAGSLEKGRLQLAGFLRLRNMHFNK